MISVFYWAKHDIAFFFSLFSVINLTCELCGRWWEKKPTDVDSSCISNRLWAQRKLVKMTTNDKTGSNSFTFVYCAENHARVCVCVFFSICFCIHWRKRLSFRFGSVFFFRLFSSMFVDAIEETAARCSLGVCGIFEYGFSVTGGHWFSGTLKIDTHVLEFNSFKCGSHIFFIDI